MSSKRAGQEGNWGVDAKTRRLVWEAAGGRCAACDSSITLSQTRCHHKRPVADGGTDEMGNLDCLCENCHKFAHGWCAYRREWRHLECGCEIRVFVGPRITPTPRALRHLGLTALPDPRGAEWRTCLQHPSDDYEPRQTVVLEDPADPLGICGAHLIEKRAPGRWIVLPSGDRVRISQQEPGG